ncbi:hypothetical protein AB0L65_59430 [Nonomuraea sp. NPDC052116]|uniref:CIS tube protein n=1 Tax=Nonomuraea sp. NPDC052116 TaxID=3155665 RepID=UPI00343937E1
MPEPVELATASLRAIRLRDRDRPAQDSAEPVRVDFNPETLRVTYSNTVSGKDQRGGTAQQFASRCSTKLSVELWFDVTRTGGATDVLARTGEVKKFLVPSTADGLAPPAVRFSWGSFLFEGVMESVDETLELFSADGRPLRSRLALSLTSQDIQYLIKPSDTGATPGTKPRAQVRRNESVQQLMGRSGDPGGWQDVAEANGVENPRRPAPGSFLDIGRGR